MSSTEDQPIVPLVDPIFGFHREIDPLLSTPVAMFGCSLTKKKNIECIDSDSFAFISGNSISIFHQKTKTFTYISSKSGNGIGCFAVHPSRKIIAVGEIGVNPNIYLYSFPELEQQRVLCGGTEISFSNICFNKNGDILASVGGNPDYMLTVWEWSNEKILLHSKAFGQDIYSIKFSNEDSGRLTTCGTGHIKFWKMTKSFTGLKLQGSTGKFGKTELSDIEAMTELRDGKVVSGSENGLLLLWEGSNAKCQFMSQQPDGSLKPCHDALITYLDMSLDGSRLVSAGSDGWIREWDVRAIDEAEVDSDKTMVFPLTVLDEYKVGDRISIKWMSRMPSEDAVDSSLYIIQSFDGSFYQYSKKTKETTLILSSHSSAISGMVCSPSEHLTVTCCSDGSVRCWDLDTRELIAHSQFNTAATSITWVPKDVFDHERILAVGFHDGVVRIIAQDSVRNKWTLLDAFKPHNTDVTCISYSPSDNIMTTGCINGQVFLFYPNLNQQSKIEHCPRGMVDLKHPIVMFDWNIPESLLLISASDCSQTILTEISLVEILKQNNSSNDSDDDSKMTTTSKIDMSNSYVLDAQPTALNVRQEDLDSFAAVFETMACLDDTAKETSESIRKKQKSQEESKSDIDEGSVFDDAVKAQQVKLMSVFSSLKFTPCLSHAIYIDTGGSSTKSVLACGRFIFSLDTDIKSSNDESVTTTNLASKIVDRRSINSQVCLLNKSQINPGELVMDLKFSLLEGAVSCPTKSENLSIKSLDRSRSNNFIIVGLSNGQVAVTPFASMGSFIRMSSQDCLQGSITSATLSFDDRYLVSSSMDGVLSVRELDPMKIMDQASNVPARAMSIEKKRRHDIGRILCDFIIKERVVPSLAKSDSTSEEQRTKPEAALVIPDLLQSELAHGPLLWNQGPISVKLANDVENNDARISPGTDITDPNAYSIYEAKSKTAQEDRLVLARKRKEKMKDSVSVLRREFSKLSKENDLLPVEYRMMFDSQEFIIDPELRKIMDNDSVERLKVIRLERENEMEISQLKFNKLRNAYLKTEFLEGFSVSSFKTGVQVRSLRCKEMSEDLSKYFVRVCESLKNEGLFSMDLEEKKDDSSVHSRDSRSRSQVDRDSEDDISIKSSHEVENACSFANRKRLRDNRRQDIKHHDSVKPSEEQDDPVDVELLKEAYVTAGNCVLKVSDDYEVPEDQRMNTDKKRQQIAILEESIFAMKMQFNERLLHFRTTKLSIIHQIKSIEQQIHDVDVQLASNTETRVIQVNVDPKEWPEDRNEVTESELAEFQLSGRTKAPPNSIVTNKQLFLRDENLGMYRRLTEEEETAFHSASDELPQRITNLSSNSARNKFNKSLSKSSEMLFMNLPQVSYAVNTRPSPRTSSRKDKHAEERSTRLELERRRLCQSVEEMTSQFDERLMELRADMFVLLSDTKLAECRAVILLSEFAMLCAFEDKDESLQQRHVRHQKEILDMEKAIRDGDDKILVKMEAISGFDAKLKDLFHKFDELVPEVDPNRLKFHKALKKKIKRVKMIINEDGEEVEDEEDDFDDESDDEEVEDIGNTCPPDMDETLFAKIMLMREERQTIEELSMEDTKTLDEVKKANERLRTRLKQLNKDAQSNDYEIRRLQLDKLRKMNRIRVSVPIQFNQIYCMSNSGSKTLDTVLRPDAERVVIHTSEQDSSYQLIPEISMTSHILIASNEIKRLCKRIVDLQEECKTQTSVFKRLKREQVALDRQRICLNSEVEDVIKKSEEIQILKFGQLVDIEQVDRAISSSGESDIDKRIEDLESSKEYLIDRANHQITNLQENLSKALEDNTALYQQIGGLKRRQFSTEGFLREHGTDGGGHEGPVIKQEIEDRSQLVSLVKLQGREIEAIKAEINLLRRKGGPTFIPALNRSKHQDMSQTSL